MKVNSIYLPQGNSDTKRQFCGICKVYYEFVDKGAGPFYCCPQCGVRATSEQMLAEQDQMLVPAHVSQPMVASKKKKKDEYDPDLPKGAVWVSSHKE